MPTEITCEKCTKKFENEAEIKKTTTVVCPECKHENTVTPENVPTDTAPGKG